MTTHTAPTGSGFWRRFTALLRKETRQMLRDRSNLAVGLLLPVVLILLFGYGLSFDVKNAPVAVVMEDHSPQARDMMAGLQGSPYIAPVWMNSMTEAEQRMRAGEVNAIVRVPQDFSRVLGMGQGRIQLVLNGVDSNTAAAVEGYVGGAIATWAQQQADRAGGKPNGVGGVQVVQRMWFNEANTSTWYLVPGLIALVMTLIGAFLDPIADKLLMTSSVVILALPQMEFANLMPRWLMVIMISRDVFIFLFTIVLAVMSGMRSFPPSYYGKASTVLQVTQRIGSLEVRHDPRRAGQSTYTLRRLITLWLSAWINFSVLPLRVATIVGALLGVVGLCALGWVAWLWWLDIGPQTGWGWLMAGLLIFSGTQLLMLGLIGEYLGRLYIESKRRPLFVVDRVITNVQSPASQPLTLAPQKPATDH